MLINNILYEDRHYTIINNNEQQIFYYFDYDKRSAEVNMTFQHLHPFYEILILLAPAASHLVGGIPYALHQGDLVLLAPSVMHKSVYYKGEPSPRIVIDFSYPLDHPDTRDAYREILSPFDAEVPLCRFDLDDQQSLFGILNDIYRFSDTHSYYGNPADEYYIHCRFQEFLYRLMELQPRNLYTNESDYSPLEHKVYEICSFIHTNYGEDLSLEILSEQFYISPAYLSRAFRKITGFGLNQYIQNTRIRNAQNMLTSSDARITRIATDCGFNSFSQFNRTFNRIAGMSPRDYRAFSGTLG